MSIESINLAIMINKLTIFLKTLKVLYKYYNKKIYNHDIQIYKHFSEIINDQMFENILSKTATCYFPSNIFGLSDQFYFESNMVSHQYINKNLQRNLIALSNSLDALASHYTSCECAENIGDVYKLIYHKQNSSEVRKNELIQINRELRRILKDCYEDYRQNIKNTLII